MKFELGERKEDFYLTASRMVPYKRVDLIAEAFSRMPEKKLIVIGDGPEMGRVRAKAGPNVSLLGYKDNPTLRSHLQRAKAFVFAAEEDFGILPVEAQACGTPVIAFGRGGAAETVNEGETGVLFPEQSAESLVNAVREFETMSFSPSTIRRQAEKFSAEVFRRNFSDFVRKNCPGWEASLGL